MSQSIVQLDIHYILSGWKSGSNIFDPRVLSLSKVLFSRRLADGNGWKDVSFHFENAFHISRGSTAEFMIYNVNWKIIWNGGWILIVSLIRMIFIFQEMCRRFPLSSCSFLKPHWTRAFRWLFLRSQDYWIIRNKGISLANPYIDIGQANRL